MAYGIPHQRTACDVGYLETSTYERLVKDIETISRQLASFVHRLRTTKRRGHKYDP